MRERSPARWRSSAITRHSPKSAGMAQRRALGCTYMRPDQRPSRTTDSLSSRIEALSILVLAVFGMLGVHTLQGPDWAPQETSSEGREFVLHTSVIPVAFEMTAVFGSIHPLLLTISSEPDRPSVGNQTTHSALIPRQE